MKELMEYREKLIERLRSAAEELCDTCRMFDDPFMKAGEGWTAHQIAFHVRDVNREVYGMRIQRTLNEENPEFKNFDPDAWMTANYNRDEALENILNEFSMSMNKVCDLLGNAPQEVWSRLSQHEALGKELTLQLWAERALAHIEEHLAGLKNNQNT
jgi:hypothetical protein